MKVRLREDGNPHWELDGRLQGRRVRISLKGCETKKEAESAAMHIWADLEKRALLKGVCPVRTHSEKALTLKALLAKDRERSGISDWTKRLEVANAKALLAVWGEGVRATALTGAMVETYKRTRQDDGAKARTINLPLQNLKAALRRAVAAGILSHEPCTIKKLPETQTVLRTLTREEAIRVLEECRKMRGGLYDFVAFLIATALRRGELFSLTWEQVDLDRRRLRVTSKKRGASSSAVESYVDLNAAAVDVLTRRLAPFLPGKPPEDALVFGRASGSRVRRHLQKPAKGGLGTVDGIQCPWVHTLGGRLKKAAQRAGVTWWKELRIHDLRHLSATLQLEAGADVRTVMANCRHRRLETTLRYLHDREERRKDALDKISLGTLEAVVIDVAPPLAGNDA